MAKHFVTKTLDDIDGTEGAELVRFGYEGKQYEIDLSEENADRLRTALAEFIAAARKAGGRGGVRGVTTSPSANAVRGERTPYDRDKAVAVREWAKGNGFPNLASKGRIPSEVIKAWEGRDVTPTAALDEQEEIDKAGEQWVKDNVGPDFFAHDRDSCEDLDRCPEHKPSPTELREEATKILREDRKATRKAAKAKPKEGAVKGDGPSDDDIMEYIRRTAGARVVKRTIPTEADRKKYDAYITALKQIS